MDAAEPLDMETMLEVVKVTDNLERVVARLKTLGSNMSVIERPSLETLEHLPSKTRFLEPGSSPLGSSRPVPIALDLEEARDECRRCAARLDEILTKCWSDTEGEGDQSK